MLPASVLALPSEAIKAKTWPRWSAVYDPLLILREANGLTSVCQPYSKSISSTQEPGYAWKSRFTNLISITIGVIELTLVELELQYLEEAPRQHYTYDRTCRSIMI